jgi:CHAT domain-containing protein
MGLGEHEQARLIYQDLLKLKQTASRDRGGAANIRIAIGSTYAMQGRYQEALDYYHQALAEVEALGYQNSIVLTLESLTEVYLAQGRYADALPLAERVVAWWRQTNFPLNLWYSLKLLGESQLGLQRSAEARRSFTEAISLIEKLREQTAGGVEERQRYLANRVSAHHLLLGMLAQERRTHEALTLAEGAKARVLLDVLQHGKVSIQKTMTPAEREQEQKLNAELARLNMQLRRANKSDQPGAQARLDKARLEYEAFQTALYAAHPVLQAQRGEAPVINAEELAALLPDAASALLEYAVTDDQTFLFAITKAAGQTAADIQIYRLPIKRGELGRHIEAFRQQLATRDLGFRATATKLYDLLLKPAQAQLKDKTNLVIVPDDKLWELPFQALTTGANRYLIEDAALSYAPSLTVLREMAKRQKPRAAAPTLLALGNPALGQETIASAALTFRDGKLDPLPDAEAEVKALGRLYGASHSKVYTGGAAREDRVKAEAAPMRVLHFATHGVLNDAAPLYSSLALTQSGAEDGLLEAWELMRMDLQADLAVLSACETARGRFGAGEGMIGLTWAMFIAGVPSTIVSQWKVESASTRQLMISFHRQALTSPATVKSKATKAEALRQSALKLMKNPATSHPFYWAGFALVGDNR